MRTYQPYVFLTEVLNPKLDHSTSHQSNDSSSSFSSSSSNTVVSRAFTSSTTLEIKERQYCSYQLLKIIAFTCRRQKDYGSLVKQVAWNEERMINDDIIPSSMIKEEIEELKQDIKIVSS